MSIARFDTLRVAAFGAITGSYTTVGTPIAFNFRLFDLTNNTNGDLFISLDGTNDNIFLPASSMKVRDLSTNAPPVNTTDDYVLAIGTQFYVRYSTAPSSGSLYIEGNYALGV